MEVVDASWEECKQTKENAGSYEATAARYVARMSPGRLNRRNVVSDVSLLNNVHLHDHKCYVSTIGYILVVITFSACNTFSGLITLHFSRCNRKSTVL